MIKTLLTSILYVSLSFAQILELEVNSFDDVPIYYEKSGNGKQVLIFIHCWSCDKSYWAGQLEYFSEDYTVITIDLAGHGESGLGRENWTTDNYANDVKAVVEKENLNNIILIGHSMGGYVALKTAQLLGYKVNALIAIDTFHDIEEVISQKDFDEFYNPFVSDFIGTTKQFVSILFGKNADSLLVKKVSDDMSSAPKEVALASFKSLYEFNEVENFMRVNIPIRFINSDKFETNQAPLEEYINDFEVKIIKNSGHFPMFEQPTEFNSVLMETIIELEKK